MKTQHLTHPSGQTRACTSRLRAKISACGKSAGVNRVGALKPAPQFGHFTLAPLIWSRPGKDVQNLESLCFLLVFAIPGAKSVPGIDQIAKENGFEAAELKYDVVWGVGHGKDEKVTAPKCSISGHLSLDATISAALR